MQKLKTLSQNLIYLNNFDISDLCLVSRQEKTNH